MRHLITLLVTIGIALAHTAGAADTATPARAMYLRYCGACHGPEGKGDGIAGSFMRPKPADLTQIAKRNGGSFPFMKVMRYVDGTEEMRAHGDPDMPVWGEVFRDEAGGDMSRRAEVRGKLLLVTEYLQSIQAH